MHSLGGIELVVGILVGIFILAGMVIIGLLYIKGKISRKELIISMAGCVVTVSVALASGFSQRYLLGFVGFTSLLTLWYVFILHIRSRGKKR